MFLKSYNKTRLNFPLPQLLLYHCFIIIISKPCYTILCYTLKCHIIQRNITLAQNTFRAKAQFYSIQCSDKLKCNALTDTPWFHYFYHLGHWEVQVCCFCNSLRLTRYNAFDGKYRIFVPTVKKIFNPMYDSYDGKFLSERTLILDHRLHNVG